MASDMFTAWKQRASAPRTYWVVVFSQNEVKGFAWSFGRPVANTGTEAIERQGPKIPPTPQEAAGRLIELYGPNALNIALECARLADADGRNDDFLFWREVVAIVFKREARH